MPRLVVALVSGLLFAFGLCLSGMIDPARVEAFLDVLGHWDPTLAGVMAGAIPVAALSFAVARRRERSFLGASLPKPPGRNIDGRLVAGAALFGVGWGLIGFCPAPALAALALDGRSFWFVAAMALGMAAHRRLFR